MTLALRRADPADAPALAHIHHQVWTETYGAIAPPDAVAALTEAHRLTGWNALLRSDDPITLIAIQAETPVGLVSFGAPTDSVFGKRGEVRHLYLLSSHRKRRHGLRLLTAALMALRDADFPGAALAVVEENARARAQLLSACRWRRDPVLYRQGTALAFTKPHGCLDVLTAAS